jgi:hypothetical protein
MADRMRLMLLPAKTVKHQQDFFNNTIWCAISYCARSIFSLDA